MNHVKNFNFFMACKIIIEVQGNRKRNDCKVNIIVIRPMLRTLLVADEPLCVLLIPVTSLIQFVISDIFV